MFKSISISLSTIKNQLPSNDSLERFAAKTKFQGPLRLYTKKDGETCLRPRTLKQKIHEMRHKDQAQQAKQAVYENLRSALSQRFKVGNNGKAVDDLMKKHFQDDQGKFHNIRLGSKFMSDIGEMKQDRDFHRNPHLEDPF